VIKQGIGKVTYLKLLNLHAC